MIYNYILSQYRDEANNFIEFKLPNKLCKQYIRHIIDTGAQNNTLRVTTLRSLFQEIINTESYHNRCFRAIFFNFDAKAAYFPFIWVNNPNI